MRRVSAARTGTAPAAGGGRRDRTGSRQWAEAELVALGVVPDLEGRSGRGGRPGGAQARRPLTGRPDGNRTKTRAYRARQKPAAG
ncbi:hypothetical protein GCM10009735_53330 [Actinomadura chokoriensis]